MGRSMPRCSRFSSCIRSGATNSIARPPARSTFRNPAAAIGAFSSLPITYLGGLAIGVAAALLTKFLNTTGPIAALPAELVRLTWSCRRPVRAAQGWRACGACKACLAREGVLRPQ